MRTGNEGAGGAKTIKTPTQYKDEVFTPLLKNLRMECEKASNWAQIKPHIDRLGGSFNEFLETLSVD